MAIIYTTAAKQARMTAVLTAIDAGSSAGYIEIGTAGMATVLATIPLADPCGSVSGATLTFTMPKSDTSADATGIAAAARIRDSNNVDVITGLTVGAIPGATDVVIDNTSINAGQTVTLTAATINHA